jgi:hypothetical protein
MRTAKPAAQTDQVRHLSENLMSQLTKGREWASPGVEAALHRVVAGLDSGVESASPTIQNGLRRLADELAVGVETLVPRVHEGRKRVARKVVAAVAAPGPAKSRRTASGKAWLIAGAVAVAVTAGLAAWLSFRPAGEEPVPSVDVQRSSGSNPDADGAPAEART